MEVSQAGRRKGYSKQGPGAELTATGFVELRPLAGSAVSWDPIGRLSAFKD